jgi:hypothetical protein
METTLTTPAGTGAATAGAATADLDRIGALCGLGFTVLAFASALVAPVAPALDDPADEIRTHMVDNQGRLGASSVLFAAAILTFVGFLAMLHRRIVARSGNGVAAAAFLAAAAATVTLGLLGCLIEATLVQRVAPGADDATVAAWFGLWDMVAYTGPPLASGLAIVVAVLVLHREFPGWLGVVGALSAIAGLVGVAVDLTTATGLPFAPDFGSFVLANVWFVGVAVAVLRRGRRAAA